MGWTPLLDAPVSRGEVTQAITRQVMGLQRLNQAGSQASDAAGLVTAIGITGILKSASPLGR
jgi:hypothetical protein